MNKKLLLSTLSLVCGFTFAQKNQQAASHDVEKCSQHKRMLEMQQTDPQRFSTIITEPAEPYQAKYKAPSSDKSGIVYTIPVVFHVIHQNGSENISAAQIQDQLNILNRDYRRLNADADLVQSVFQGMPADVELEFKFATVAPNGACFNGITRTVSSTTNSSGDGILQVNAVIAGNDVYQGIWPHNKYLNIYIANNLIDGAAGYTYLPNGNSSATADNMKYNGIFLLQDYCGSIGTSNVTSSRALTHEVGHWLNLPHIWGDDNPGLPGNCSDDDGVQDTPNCIGVTSCSLNSNTCNSDDAYWGSAMKDNVENYMDYSYCSKMFTAGQATRMRTALLSSVGGRANISTNANLQAVGAIPGTSLCALDFSASQTGFCAGTTINYTANTSTGIATYAWTFQGGTPGTSSAANPSVTYNTPGTYNATLVVTSTANGSSYTEAKTSYIVVGSAGTPSALPYSQGFATATFPPTGWSLVNGGVAGTWARTTSAGLAPSAGNAMWFNNYNIDETVDDEARLVPLNFSGMGAAQMTFDVAYQMYGASNVDGLEILVSSNCGGTFTSVYSKSGATLATVAGNNTNSFVPTVAGQWRSETVDLSAFAGQGSVVVAFRNLSGYGNNIYVDNINITGTPVSNAPVASFSATTTSICTGQTVTYTSTSTNNPTSYSWTFAGGTPPTSTAANPTVTYAAAGTYNVSLTATNGDGSGSTTQNNYVTVNANVVPAFNTYGPYCSGAAVPSLPATSTNGVDGTWSPSAINNTTGGTYTFTAGAGECATGGPQSISVTINPAPTVSFGSVASMCVYSNPVTLTQGSPAGGTYSGGGVSGGQFNPANAGLGNETLSYTFTNGQGCSATATTVVFVDECLGVNEADKVNVSIFPNPSSGVVKIVSADGVISKITVYDFAGRLVISKTPENQFSEVDLSDQAAGIYQVEIETESSVLKTPVFIQK